MNQETSILHRSDILAEDTKSPTPPSLPVDRSNETKENRFWSHLPQLLRWIGGISLLGSAIAFLLGGWMNAEPLIRYYSFFALTSALSIAGIFCGMRLKEDKGARTFLSLGTAFIPVLFCQLGALVFAQITGRTSQFTEYFTLFAFDPVGIPTLGATLAIAIVFLSSYAFLGFSAMARSEAKRLTGVYLLSNVLLLLPYRDGNIVALIGFVLLVGLVFMDMKFFSKQSSLKTWDGRAMRSLLFAPFVLLLLRSALLYSVSGVMLSLLFAAIAALFFLGLPQSTENVSLKKTYQYVSLFPLFVAWMTLIDSAININAFDSLNGIHTFGILPFAAIVAALSFHAHGKGGGFRLIASATAVFAVILQLADLGGVITASIALSVSIFVTIGSYFVREKGLLFIGLTGTLFSVLYHVGYAIEFYQSNLWLSLAGTGVFVILCASYIERNWQKIVIQGKDLRTKLHDWS